MDWPLHKDISQAIETGNWQLGLASLRVWARDMQSRLTELEAKVGTAPVGTAPAQRDRLLAAAERLLDSNKEAYTMAKAGKLGALWDDGGRTTAFYAAYEEAEAAVREAKGVPHP